MAYVALSKVMKDSTLVVDHAHNPSPALKTIFLRQAHRFYCYFFEQAADILRAKHNDAMSLLHTAQASAATALVALHVAALQIVLVWTRGDDLQLTSAVETGITPANLMHNVTAPVIPTEPPLPSLPAGEGTSLSSLVALTDENSQVASQIMLDSHQWNRLRPAYRDYLLASSRAAEKHNPHDRVLKTALLRISTFYPDDPDLLLLMSAMFYTRKEFVVTLFLAKALLDLQLKNNSHTAESLTNMAAAYAALGRLDLAEDCIARTRRQPGRCWPAIRMDLHLKRKPDVQSASESRILAGLRLQACEDAERKILTEDGSSPSFGFALDELHEMQRLRLLRGRLLLQHRKPLEALEVFVSGIQVGLALPSTASESSVPDSARPTCRHLFMSLYLHICHRRVVQQGTQAARDLDDLRSSLKRGTQGKYEPEDVLQYAMPFAGMFPDLLANLPLPAMEGIVPPILLTPQSLQNLAASVLGTASTPYVTLPAALSENINQNIRTVADNKVCALTSLLIFGVCRIMEDKRSQRSAEEQTDNFSTALFANTGFRFCTGTKLMLYYLSLSLKPTPEAIVNMCIIFASMHGTLPSKVQSSGGIVSMKPLDFAVLWARYGVEKQLLKADDPAVLEMSKLWQESR